jgi:hypothetical protein
MLSFKNNNIYLINTNSYDVSDNKQNIQKFCYKMTLFTTRKFLIGLFIALQFRFFDPFKVK